MTKEELEKLERGHKILNDIDELKKRLEDVENILSRGTISKGMLIIRDDFIDTRVSLPSSELCGTLLKVVYHALKHNVEELEKQFEEL